MAPKQVQVATRDEGFCGDPEWVAKRCVSRALGFATTKGRWAYAACRSLGQLRSVSA